MVRSFSVVLTLVLSGCSGSPGGGTGGTGAGGASSGGGDDSLGGAVATAGSGGMNVQSGGSAGSAGSAAGGGGLGAAGSATGGSSSHLVVACPTSDQGGPGVVGVFEDITPPDIDLSQNGVLSAAVDQVNTTNLYAAGDHQGVYKSTDCGATWNKISTGRNADVLESGMQWSMVIDPVAPDVLFAGNLYGANSGLYRSTNGGVDWDLSFPPNDEIGQIINFAQEVAIDPTNHEHVLLSLHDNCKGDYAPACMAESTDSGVTWRLVKLPTAGWSHNANPFPLDASSWFYGAGADGMFLTEDGGETWEKVTDSVMNQMYLASDGSYYVASLNGVRYSTDRHSWSVLPNSGKAIAVIGDGTRVFESDDIFAAQKPFHAALETDPQSWSALDSPELSHGANRFSYDPDHHILYAPSCNAGLWRMVTY
ncbi:MAG TPA: hypothetical protein VGP93_09670 [Polyangiaceae bacterium]|jgi:hypothetical protein|nr:hypothetical protein [Polyangiaceae bacterium]